MSTQTKKPKTEKPERKLKAETYRPYVKNHWQYRRSTDEKLDCNAILCARNDQDFSSAKTKINLINQGVHEILYNKTYMGPTNRIINMRKKKHQTRTKETMGIITGASCERNVSYHQFKLYQTTRKSVMNILKNTILRSGTPPIIEPTKWQHTWNRTFGTKEPIQKPGQSQANISETNRVEPTHPYINQDCKPRTSI